MKAIFILVIIILNSSQLFSQTDKNGNPVFNSISLSEKTFQDGLLIANYYTLKNNIDNKESSVFISKNLTLDEIQNAAVNLASDFFILTRKSKLVAMIMLQTKPAREWIIFTAATNKRETFPFTLSGDITENRANELMESKLDSLSTVENGILTFNNKKFRIITGNEIEREAIKLIEEQNLHKKKASKVTLLSKGEMRSYILENTKKGGELDFFTPIQGKEYQSIQVKPGIFTSQVSIALYKWGRACYNIGVNKVEDAYAIFSEYKNRALNELEKAAIKMGFYKELEK